MSEKVTEEQKRCAHKEGWITSTDGIVCQWCDMPVAQIVDALDAERKAHAVTHELAFDPERHIEPVSRLRFDAVVAALDAERKAHGATSDILKFSNGLLETVRARVQELENRCECGYHEGECPRCRDGMTEGEKAEILKERVESAEFFHGENRGEKYPPDPGR